MRKFSLFNFLEKKIKLADVSPVAIKLIDQFAFKELALHIGISYIANTLSKCEFKVFEEGKEVKNKLYYMLNVSPNPNENSSLFINKFIENYYYNGHALIVPEKEHIYCADNFTVDDSDPLKEYSYYNVALNSRQLKKKYKSSEVFYIKLDNKNVRNLIDTLYMQYGEIIAMALNSYKRTNGTKYKLLLEQYQQGDTNFQKQLKEVIEVQLKSFLESSDGIYPQNNGYDLQEFGNGKSPKDTSDIISMRKETFEVVAQALKIPLTMMYGNITNMNEIVKVFLSICIDPLADMISEELTRKYYSYEQWKKGNRIMVDTSCINHIDILEVADKADKAISSGIASIDELRNRLNMLELGTEFSTSHFITKNYELAENALKQDIA